MFGKLKRAMMRSGNVQELYAMTVAQSRLPGFYGRGGIPDSVDGRFELLALHMVAVLRALKSDEREVKLFAQELYDFMFHAMDVAMREDSVGDSGVSKRIRNLTESFSGRIVAYEKGLRLHEAGEGLEDEADGLKAALRRNLLGTLSDEVVQEGQLEDFAAYFIALNDSLQEQGRIALLEARVTFPNADFPNG
ncbi:ubiquinol-cytochrome C chaperone family protein [Kiloniella sp. b19]|uniref:ubiquinol-cytochrome C chaperone family protein n=1 Tax=Kiloniella sp. GXU_MW_B19 TaxID=3141326 RepID=UPI0031DCA8CD